MLLLILGIEACYNLSPAIPTAWTKELYPKCRLYWCFCLEWCSNFVGSESGEKQSVKLLQNILWEWGRVGGGQSEGRGATFHKGGSKIPT
jgi:hypothetical protein